MASTVRVAVTAEHIAFGSEGWEAPIERALFALTGQAVNVDGGDQGGGCIATIGASDSSTTLVVELPAAANAWLDARWASLVGGARPLAGEPFSFDLELSDWLVDLICSRARR